MSSQYQRDRMLGKGEPASERLSKPLGPILGVLQPSSAIATANYLQLLDLT